MFGRFFGRKAVETKFLVEYVVFPIIVGLIIVLLVFTPAAKAVGEKGFLDELCHLNAGFSAWALTSRAIPLYVCDKAFERIVSVDANDWKTCDPGNKKGWKASNDIKRCAEQQLYNLAARCWYMGGEGNWNLVAGEVEVRLDCFKAHIKDLGQYEITEGDLTDASVRADNCKFLQNKDGPKTCGSSDNIDWDSQYAIKSQTTTYICLNERGSYDDAIKFAANQC